MTDMKPVVDYRYYRGYSLRQTHNLDWEIWRGEHIDTQLTLRQAEAVIDEWLNAK